MINVEWLQNAAPANAGSSTTRWGYSHGLEYDLPDTYQARFARGVRNLLINCAGCQQGDKILIVVETDTVGYYDPAMGHAIRSIADECGFFTELCGVPLNREVQDPDADLVGKMHRADTTLFLARLGDQIRFRPKNVKTTQIISYALDSDMLASPFGTIDYQAFEGLAHLVNDTLSNAADIHVTCPAGTDFGGAPRALGPCGDTTLKRFPISVFAPLPTQGFRGRIAQNGFLTGTGSHYYSPGSCGLQDTLFVSFEGNRIVGFDGAPHDIAAAKSHYEFVGQKYGIDTYYVHSWHAGIHPGCTFHEPASSNFERWSGGAFGNPRILHFHTCGAYPPGEISLNILDPTVWIDGVAIWENGVLHPERIAGGSALLQAYPDMRAAFDHPATQVGQAACGKLMYA